MDVLGLEELRPKKHVYLLGVGATRSVRAPVYRLKVDIPNLRGPSLYVDTAFTEQLPDNAGLLGNRDFLAKLKVEFHDGVYFVIRLGDALAAKWRHLGGQQRYP